MSAPKPKAQSQKPASARTTIAVQGARVHNLKNISVEIPRDRLIVMTGLSGSGKSSLAFDTIYAEGQRRYMESLSSFAKRFVAQVAKPDVDFVFGLSPVISIEQKTLTNNPRSTVGTMTDIASYLNLLYATIGEPHCPRTGEPVPSRTSSQILEAILSLPEGTAIELRAPVFKVYGEDLEFVFTEIRKKGVRRLIVDGKPVDLADKVELDESSVTNMDAVVDRFVVGRKHEKAIKAGIAAALLVGDGLLQVHVEGGLEEVLRRDLQQDAAFRLRRHRSRLLHVQQSRRARAAPAAASAWTSSRIRICWCPTRSAASPAAVSCRRPTSTTRRPGTGASCTACRRRSGSRSTRRGRICPQKIRHAILYGIDKKITMTSPPEAKIGRDKWEGQRDELSRDRAPDRALVPAATASGARPARRWRRGSTR